jgi:DNA-binding MarR family transcriptional regulator
VSSAQSRTAPSRTESQDEADPAESARANLVAQTAAFAEAFERWMEANMANGLSYPRLRLLEALHCKGPGIMRDIADQIGLTPRNMTATVDSLEQDGLVSRRPHPSDRRATIIELTGAGREAADTAITPRIDAIAALFDDLSKARQAQFLQAVTTLTEGLRRRGIRV